ncbi:MAG: hypothetical protein GF353_25370 [Candidatus Lokiarchaeota archaeon]|nr:hypothetical protein [Candidatus Lokiarchaeota archaeon]
MFDQSLLNDRFYSEIYPKIRSAEEENKKANWEKRMIDRKSCEENAVALLSKPITEITPEDIYVREAKGINSYGALNLLDVDNYDSNGVPAQHRFGVLMSNISRNLYPAKQYYAVDKDYFKILRERIVNLLSAKDDENIERSYNALCGVRGVRAALCTVLLYAEDSKNYNVMTPALVKAIIDNDNKPQESFSFYLKYNQFVNQFKNKFNFQPQEIDLILFGIGAKNK